MRLAADPRPQPARAARYSRAVSRENVELLQAMLSAYNERGVEAMLAYIDPEFEVTVPPSLSVEPDTYRGHEGMRHYFESFADVMDEVRFEAEAFFDAGDKVVAETRLMTRGRETGLEVEQLVVQVWTVRGGRAVKAEVFPTRAEALRAAGLEDDSGE
jgi:ketosteroid isomerase-like protein